MARSGKRSSNCMCGRSARVCAAPTPQPCSTASVEPADPWLHLRRRLAGAEAELDFPLLTELADAGATDYFAEVVRFGANGDPSRGTGIGYTFTTDRPRGFTDDDLVLLKAVLP